MDVVKTALPVSNFRAREDALTDLGRAFNFAFQPLRHLLQG